MLAAACCASAWAQPAQPLGTEPPPETEIPPGTKPTPAPTWTLDEDDINLGAPAPPADSIEPLIAELGSPEYATREQTSEELIARCPGAFKAMSRAYRESDNLEIRLRIESIVREQYLWHTLLKHNGFLGISYPPNGYTTLPDGSLAIHVSDVREGTAAARAKLRKRDLIRAIDGEPFSHDPDAEPFRDRVQKKGAGAKIVLDILRGDRAMSIEVTLQARPLKYYENEMKKPLNKCMQARAIWWDKYFAARENPNYRMPSTAVLEIPK